MNRVDPAEGAAREHRVAAHHREQVPHADQHDVRGGQADDRHGQGRRVQVGDLGIPGHEQPRDVREDPDLGEQDS